MLKRDLLNPFLGFDKYIYINDPEDFQMPYSVYGETDKSILKDRYDYLRNRPKDYRFVRFSNYLEDFK